jgi:hypothetical protein
MRFIEEFHQPNVPQHNHSKTIQEELLKLGNQLESAIAEPPNKSEVFLNLKDIRNPFTYKKEDRNSVRLMRTFKLLKKQIDSGKLVIKVREREEIYDLLQQFQARLIVKKYFAGVPVYFVESELDFGGVALSNHGELVDDLLQKLFNHNSPNVSLDYAKDNNFGGIMINTGDGHYNQEVLNHEIGHVIDDVTRSSRKYEQNQNIKPVEKELCHNFITEFMQYATFGREGTFIFGDKEEFSQIIMQSFFYYKNGLRSPDIFGRYKKQCQTIADKYGQLYEIIDNDDSGIIQNNLLSKVRKADSLDSLNKIVDKFLEKYGEF